MKIIMHSYDTYGYSEISLVWPVPPHKVIDSARCGLRHHTKLMRAAPYYCTTWYSRRNLVGETPLGGDRRAGEKQRRWGKPRRPGGPWGGHGLVPQPRVAVSIAFRCWFHYIGYCQLLVLHMECSK